MGVSFDIQGKVAVVTGGGGVLCSAIARQLAEKGAQIAVLDLSEANAQKVADEINGKGGVAIALSADVLDRQSVEAAKQAVLERFQRVDILVNGAGGNNPKATTSDDLSFFELPPESIRWVFDLNFLGSVIPSQVFGQEMAKVGEGSIVNMASMSSYHPLTRTVAYSAAKAAISNFTEWASTYFCQNYSAGIRVNAIAPGFLLTEQNRYLLTNQDGSSTPRGDTVLKNTPMGRYGNPEELAGSVIFLCSDAARFITGVVLPVDGGFSSYWGV